VSGLVGPVVTYALTGLQPELVTYGNTTQVAIRQLAAAFSTTIMVYFVVALTPMAAAGTVSSVLPLQASFALSALMGILCFAMIFFSVKSRKWRAPRAQARGPSNQADTGPPPQQTRGRPCSVCLRSYLPYERRPSPTGLRW